MSNDRIATGDRGQRYEVTFFNPNTEQRQVLGWCRTIKGAESMRDGVYKHPSWHSPEIRDRQEGTPCV